MKSAINISLQYDNMYGHIFNDGEYFHIGPPFAQTDVSFPGLVPEICRCCIKNSYA